MKELREFKDLMIARVDTQTSWGKTQMKQVINDIYQDILERKVEATRSSSASAPNQINEDK